MTRPYPVPLLIALSLGACGAEPPAEPVERSSHSIFGGEDSGAEDDAVVWLTKPEGICSGVLVAKNLVLTAMHCVSDYDDSAHDFTCSANGELENGGNGQGEMGPEHPPERIEVGSVPTKRLAAGQRIFSTHTVTVCTNDLALVLLDRELDLPIHPIELTAPPRFDDTMTIIGYGQTDSADAIGRQRRTGIDVLDIGVPPRTFTLGPGGCKGDSGGPAVNERTGAIAGVYSTYVGDCGSSQVRNIYTSLTSFDDLILEAFEAAGATPWLAGEPEPMPGVGGAGGATGEAGASGDAGQSGDAGAGDGASGSAPAGGKSGGGEGSGCSISITGTARSEQALGLMSLLGVAVWVGWRRVARLVQLARAE